MSELHSSPSASLLRSLTAAAAAASSSPAASAVATSSSSSSSMVSPAYSPPARKKRKVDYDGDEDTKSLLLLSRRKGLEEQRQAKLQRAFHTVKSSLEELYFLQKEGHGLFDLPGLRRKPTAEFVSFLMASNAPDCVTDEIRTRVIGSLPPSSLPSPETAAIVTPRCVSSAAQAVALTAAGFKLRSSQPAPVSKYSPKADRMSPVQLGEQLQPLTELPASRASSCYTREQLNERMRQETWVVRRAQELAREGLWTEKRLPKVCEKPKPKTHWDVLLNEMRWEAVDFYQERKWKKAAARLLAESAKRYVDKLPQKREQMQKAKEKRLRGIAKFISGEILSFWNDMSIEVLKRASESEARSAAAPVGRQQHVVHSAKHAYSTEEKPACCHDVIRDNNHTYSLDPRLCDLSNMNHTYSSSNSIITLAAQDVVDVKQGLLNDQQDQDDLLPDDVVSTIQEQECFELQHTIIDSKYELDCLRDDLLKPVDYVLNSQYPAYPGLAKQCENEDDEEEEEDDDDEDEEEDGDGKEEETMNDESDDLDVSVKSVTPSLSSASLQSPSDGESVVLDDDLNHLDSEPEDLLSLEDVETVIPLKLFPVQKKMYEDYLARPESSSALEKCDSVSISCVVKALRKICNLPSLLDEQDSSGWWCDQPFRTFDRVADSLTVSKLVLTATDYDPYAHIDLGSLNLVFLQHETTLTAITSDRIRKCCAPRVMIEELPSKPDKVIPPVPEGRFLIEIPSSSVVRQPMHSLNGQHILLNAIPLDYRPSKKPGKNATSDSGVDHQAAFHKDSLNVIARFNERRCMGMPLYGQDLLDALTVVDTVRPPLPTGRNHRIRNSGQGYVNCLIAGSASWKELEKKSTCPARLLRLPWTSMSLGSSGKSRSNQKRTDYRYEAPSLRLLVDLISHHHHHHHSHSRIHSDLCSSLHLLQSHSRTLHHLQSRLHPSLTLVNHYQLEQQPFPLASAPPAPRHRIHSDWKLNSAKLTKLDDMLRQFRLRGQKAIVFCEMPEMLDLLRQYLLENYFSFLLLEPQANVSRNKDLIVKFAHRQNILVLLLSTETSVAQLPVPYIHNIVFFDSNWNNNSQVALGKNQQAAVMISPCLEWCKRLRQITNNSVSIFRLVSEGTVEDSITIKALQQKILGDIRFKSWPENGSSSIPIFKMNRKTLEALLSPHFSDNGLIDRPDRETSCQTDDDHVEDPEAMVQLDWLWGSKISSSIQDAQTMVELSQELDSYCVPTCQVKEDHCDAQHFKPIARYAIHWIDELRKNPDFVDCDLIEPWEPSESSSDVRLEWEQLLQNEFMSSAAEMDYLESLPLLTYSSEDANRTWHGRDGQPMPLWAPPTPSMTMETDLVEHHVTFLYKSRLMEESELPPVYVKKDVAPVVSNKRNATEAGMLDMSHAMEGMPRSKYRKEDMMASVHSSAPKSLFDRPQTFVSKAAAKVRNRMPVSAMNRGQFPAINLQTPVASLRHPLPRPQVESENVPEWLIQEDWALLHAIKELQELPVNLSGQSPAQISNWDLVSDMVNSVSRCYRSPRQCKNRFENIVLPREEGKIFDMPSHLAAMTACSTAAMGSNKKSNKKKGNVKMNVNNSRPMKTSGLYVQDNNTAWSAMYASRFESIKAVANKRTPTTKPLVVNPALRNAQPDDVFTEAGINYDVPMNPIQVAIIRAERIQREKQRSQQDQQQQLAQQRTAAAQAAAQAAAVSAAQQHARMLNASIASSPQHILQTQMQQAQAAVVAAGNSNVAANAANVAAAAQTVVVGISQPLTTVTNAQLQNVLQGRIQQSHQVQQATARNLPQQIGIQELVRVCSQQPSHSTVVVTSQPSGSTVVSVANLTPSQLQAAQKLVTQSAALKGGVVTAQGRTLTPQQVNLLRQQQQQQQQNALKKVAANDKARVQALQLGQAACAVTSASQVTAVGTITTSGVVTSTPQKVTVSGVSLAGANAVSAASNMGTVTVVTQAMAAAAGQPKTTHLIRQVTAGGKTNVRSMTESEMRLILASKQQQLQQGGKGQQVAQLQVTSQGSLAQLLAGNIHVQPSGTATGAQVATLVKTMTAGQANAQAGGGGQSVTLPLTNVNIPQVKAALARSGAGLASPAQMQLALRQQIFQQQRKAGTAVATATLGQQKLTLSQVGGKGLPAQLIVSTAPGTPQKQNPQAVTVQQIQQIVKSVQPGAGMAGSAAAASAGQLVSTQSLGLPHLLSKQQAVVSAAGGTSTTVATIITTGAATTTTATLSSAVHARVIPVSSSALARGTQQIQVVAAAPGQVVTTSRQLSGAPNVTVDASGRPTSTTAYVTTASGATAAHIRLATTQQQFLTTLNSSGQPVTVRAPVGVLTHQAGQATKLHVVGPGPASNVSQNASTPNQVSGDKS